MIVAARCLLLFVASFVLVHGDGEFVVLHSPKGIAFKGHLELGVSELKDVLKTSLGYTVENEDSDWSGLDLKPFSHAKSVVLFVVPGVKTLGSGMQTTFPLRVDENLQNIYNEIIDKTEQRYPTQSPIFLNVVLQNDLEVSGTLKLHNKTSGPNAVPDVMSLKYLYLDEGEDIEFIRELRNLRTVSRQIAESVNEVDDVPDVYWIVLPNLSSVSEVHGPDAKETEEAKKLLFSEIISAANTFDKLYEGEALVGVVTSEEGLSSRIKRETEEKSDWPRLNLADDYDPDFPVIFNIILWFSILMIISVAAIAMTIASMDPGRDSIIYRMTSTRMKKDN